MKSIGIVTGGYPTPNEPGRYTFVDQLACAWADLGLEVYVICPIPAFVELRDKKRFYRSYWEKATSMGSIVKIFSPRFLSFADRPVAGIPTIEFSMDSYISSVRRVVKKKRLPIDVLYSHFLNSGCCAGQLGEELGIPSFCAFGESSLWSIEKRRPETVRAQLSKLTGMVSVSTENKRILVDNGLFREEDIKVFPNGVNHELFYPRDKAEMRKKLGFPQDAVIGAYTGAFSESKGVLRAQEAAVKAGNVKMIYIGGGELQPQGENILFKGKLPHSEIPDYLSAADFFILPTKAEGCCNAIIEAMACGLPVISSDSAFNDDILGVGWSIRCGSDDVEELSKSVRSLVGDEQRRAVMSNNALDASKKFDVNKRAANILSFINNKSKSIQNCKRVNR